MNEGIEARVKFSFETGYSNPAQEFLRVRYRPPTPESLRGESIAEQLSNVLLEIDLTDEGRKLEPSVEVLELLPVHALENIAQTILGDYCPTMREVADLEIFYSHKGHSRGRAPADLEIFEFALDLNRTPEEIRGMSRRDRLWLMGVKIARSHQKAQQGAQE